MKKKKPKRHSAIDIYYFVEKNPTQFYTKSSGFRNSYVNWIVRTIFCIESTVLGSNFKRITYLLDIDEIKYLKIKFYVMQNYTNEEMKKKPEL